jgi:hypothetical protein
MMMFPRRTLAAAAALASTLAIAAPVASARVERTPVTHKGKAHKAAPPAATPGAPICVLLLRQLQFAQSTGNPILINLVGRTMLILGCGGAAI